MITLSWIRSLKELKVFEENRISDIKKMLHPKNGFTVNQRKTPLT